MAFILAACQLSAQSLDSITHHQCGYYGPNGGGIWENAMQQWDGNILFNRCEGINFRDNSSGDIVGNVLFKISRHGADILDTLVVYDSDPPFYLFAKNPNGEGHLRVGTVHDTTSGSTFLKILPFDDDLNFDTLQEVFVPLSDTIVYNYNQGTLINKHDDLVFLYAEPDPGYGNYDSYNLNIACFGLDGSKKHENAIPYTTFSPNGWRWTYYGLGIFNESPLEYFIYGLNVSTSGSGKKLVCHVFDSLFQHKESFSVNGGTINPQVPQKEFLFGWYDCFLVDGDDFIIGSRYTHKLKDGVCLVRYDKQTLELKDEVYFESNPLMSTYSITLTACPIALQKDSEGSLCFAYNTQTPYFTDQVRIAVVKLSSDFGVQWQRICLQPAYNFGEVMTVLDDGGVAVAGKHYGAIQVFFLILSDDGWAVSETGVQIRPYAYWPNPVQDELHLQYSPDVTPQSIELYDLQGRLVHTQRNGLESLSMKGLASGAYTMRVVLEDGKVFVDKVVKE